METNEEFLVPPPPGVGEDYTEPAPEVPVPAMSQIKADMNAEGREKLEMVARDAGISDDDPLFQIVRIVQEHDHRAVARLEREEELAQKVLTAIEGVPDKLLSVSSNLNSAVADYGKQSQLTGEAATKALGIAEAVEKAALVVSRRGWIAIGLAGLLAVFGLFVGGIGLSSLGRAKTMTVQLQAGERRSQISLEVLELAWQKMLLQEGKQVVREEWATLKAKPELSTEDVSYRDALQTRWQQLQQEEGKLSEKEKTLALKLDQEVGHE